MPNEWVRIVFLNEVRVRQMGLLAAPNGMAELMIFVV